MSDPGEARFTKCPKRFQLMFLKACVASLLVWLVLHALADADPPFPRQVSWRFANFFRVKGETFSAFSKRLETPRKRHLVLVWNNYFSQKTNWLPPTLDLGCPVSECDSTSDRSLLENSSAIILHWRNINLNDLPACNISNSNRCPLWVLFNTEAPPHTSKDTLKAIEGKVHWTATYRRDSEVFAGYGKVISRSVPHHKKTVLDPNKHLVCWLVSNCKTPSRREMYVSELEKYIAVDVYGKCRNKQCPHKTIDDCYSWMSERCLFYLSLENSLCKEYTTEKIYQALSQTDMIPIVMGNSSNYKHLPPNSYINALDFSGPKGLAEHLVRVSRDVELYQSYLAWKMYYEVEELGSSLKWFCDLCAMLHSTDIRNVEPRKNLVSWWYDESSCWSWQK